MQHIKEKYVIRFRTARRHILKVFDFGAFQKKCICPHAKNISFTCFLGHFKEPPVNELELYRINVKIFDDKFMFAYSADSEILLNIASIYIFILLFKSDRFLKFSEINKI